MSDLMEILRLWLEALWSNVNLVGIGNKFINRICMSNLFTVHSYCIHDSLQLCDYQVVLSLVRFLPCCTK